VPRYLSREWLAAARDALTASDALSDAAYDVRLTVQQNVTAGPEGDVAFHIIVDHGTVQISEGQAADPTVTFTQEWSTARAVARGEMSAQGAFMRGLISVRGDVPKLVEYGAVFVGLDDVLFELRAQTEY